MKYYTFITSYYVLELKGLEGGGDGRSLYRSSSFVWLAGTLYDVTCCYARLQWRFVQ
jgi:hypothetical protein